MKTHFCHELHSLAGHHDVFGAESDRLVWIYHVPSILCVNTSWKRYASLPIYSGVSLCRPSLDAEFECVWRPSGEIFPCISPQLDFSYQTPCPFDQNPTPIRDVLDTPELFEAEVSATHLYMAMGSSRAASDTELHAHICSPSKEQGAPVNHQARSPFEFPVSDSTEGHVVIIPQHV